MYNNKDLSRVINLNTEVLVIPPKRFKLRTNTQRGNLLLPAKLDNKKLDKYLLITEETDVRIDGELKSKTDISTDLIDKAKCYWVKGQTQTTNVKLTFINIQTV